ncbi:MAG: ATP synthase subunit delta [Alphaproteobacteria bacterium MarineAlpha5_Bin5]|nr:MAG: ATP synthase subunit delta [Alphaproteobacteria bacterium MarineAlpha5_Bin5]PPR52780.1 MAG: ATP synthase subunit delta [Alphaproteobacteria bacterium MarineAlpha5_Bin4]|tara:strand:- start:2408 stop:2965 length:558 start_codon:yes stop_codon:yes gene_type:complete
MTSQLASGDLISDRYASALYDLASEKKLVDPVLSDLSLLKKLLKENKDLNLVIKSPLVSSQDKLSILDKLLLKINANKLTSTFLKVLEKNKRFSNLASIISQFININSQKRGDVLADVTSADKLNDEQKTNITNQLKNILGDKLSLNFDVDKNIIGGLIVKVGSKMIDTSLINKINKLKIAIKGA